MKSLIQKRHHSQLSQRKLARKAGISYKSLQLIETGQHDTKISTLTKIVLGLGYPKNVFMGHLYNFFRLPQDSIAIISRQILSQKKSDWKIPFFNFVDAFRREKDTKYVEEPPCEGLSENLRALLASTVEYLCRELSLPVPYWCGGVSSLRCPYFVAGVENLKASALIESPADFRKRNIFVLGNFLERA